MATRPGRRKRGVETHTVHAQDLFPIAVAHPVRTGGDGGRVPRTPGAFAHMRGRLRHRSQIKGANARGGGADGEGTKALIGVSGEEIEAMTPLVANAPPIPLYPDKAGSGDSLRAKDPRSAR